MHKLISSMSSPELPLTCHMHMFTIPHPLQAGAQGRHPGQVALRPHPPGARARHLPGLCVLRARLGAGGWGRGGGSCRFLRQAGVLEQDGLWAGSSWVLACMLCCSCAAQGADGSGNAPHCCMCLPHAASRPLPAQAGADNAVSKPVQQERSLTATVRGGPAGGGYVGGLKVRVYSLLSWQGCVESWAPRPPAQPMRKQADLSHPLCFALTLMHCTKTNTGCPGVGRGCGGRAD